MRLLTQVPLYDNLATDYDRFVNWEERLARELPFLERLFIEQGVQRILDAACGTGHHAIALAQRGYWAMGADLSAAMIEYARENARTAGAEVRFIVAGFGHLSAIGEKDLDAVLCLGNSLPHLLTESAVTEALTDFSALLRPGGLLVIQNRNFDRVWVHKERFMEPQSYQADDKEWFFLRFYDFHDETVTFNMIRLYRTENGWTQAVESIELRPLFRDELANALAESGFTDATFYGGYDGSAFDLARSNDLIVVATRS
ncbi:MAG: class I SAM-dependent methyltransferase [Anaerolineae bacterium]